MKYRLLVFDHDDTAVNSTATIHHPCFVRFLEEYYPGRSCSLEEYFLKNFSPGFLAMCREEYGMDDETLEKETAYWRAYVSSRVPKAYPGIRELMLRHRREGGMLAVISHSYGDNILRDYRLNGLPEPDLVFGWEMPPEKRKPSPWPLQEVLRQSGLKPEQALVIDDLKPGYDMAKSCGVPFAAAGWANDIPEIEAFMRRFSGLYFKTVSALTAYLFDEEVSL
ncbi:MAG: HAD hydrolase-like protein [Oscillospiraceae bacterium]|nr:HAD hydrolase-like protein [Oscillospiraceae bacterium]MBQ6609981.1 HAD hydrolase-like protein [Oscillospiraceae bacterium]MBQ9331353.1 HAD hydrolase-like protein [Oscillospiraceae bacterium]